MVRRAGPAAALAGGLGVLGALLLPWVRSGLAERNGFEAARTARILGVADDPLLRLVLIAVYLVPSLVALLWLAVVVRRRVAAVAVAAAIAVVGFTAAAIVLASDLEAGDGPIAAIAASTIAAAGAGAMVVRGGPDDRHP